MSSGDLFPFADIGDIHAGADDVFQLAAERLNRGLDDRQGSLGLFADGFGVGSVGVDADRSGNCNEIA